MRIQADPDLHPCWQVNNSISQFKLKGPLDQWTVRMTSRMLLVCWERGTNKYQLNFSSSLYYALKKLKLSLDKLFGDGLLFSCFWCLSSGWLCGWAGSLWRRAWSTPPPSPPPFPAQDWSPLVLYTSVVYNVCMRLESASISAVDPDPHSFSLLDPEPRWKDWR